MQRSVMDEIFEENLHVFNLLQKHIIEVYEKQCKSIDDEISFCKEFNYPYTKYEAQRQTCLRYIMDAKKRLQQ
jgi:hypothetical protein